MVLEILLEIFGIMFFVGMLAGSCLKTDTSHMWQ